MNPDLPSAINQWHIVFDPYGFSLKSSWLEDAEKTEDILQLAHVYDNGPVIDVGFYRNRYKVYVIKDQDWDEPIEEFESRSCDKIVQWVYHALSCYENGF